MEEAQQKALGVVFSAILATSALLLGMGGQKTPGQPGIRQHLPERLGDWTGVDIRYCSNRDCQATYFHRQVDAGERCPVCQAPLDSASYGERATLPRDTTIVKKHYQSPEEHSLTCTIVLMGSDRTSIHRPEACLVGQGYSLVSQQIISVDATPGPPEVTLLRIARSGDGQHDPGSKENAFFFAYWFVAPGVKTHSRTAMQMKMATDRLFRRTVDQWAYIYLFGRVALATPDDIKELAALISEATDLNHNHGTQAAQ